MVNGGISWFSMKYMKYTNQLLGDLHLWNPHGYSTKISSSFHRTAQKRPNRTTWGIECIVGSASDRQRMGDG